MSNRGALAAFAAFVVAGCIWTPFVHVLFKKNLDSYRDPHGVSTIAQMLAATHLAVWSDADLPRRELDKMRQRNPEWDFMSRTYFVLALVNMALRDKEYLAEARDIVDAIIETTVEVERERGFEHFLMSYGHGEGGSNSRPEACSWTARSFLCWQRGGY
ncbi:MAG: hypothetical protein GTN81_04890 [Proteobacteria bacterium]|nr:hypothetical protein [Pseudomonadota bacterium]